MNKSFHCNSFWQSICRTSNLLQNLIVYAAVCADPLWLLYAETSISCEPVMSLSLNVALRVRTGRSTLNTYSRPPDKSQGRPLKIKLTQKKAACSFLMWEKVHDCCCWQRNMMASINSDVLARWRGGYLAVMDILHA